jgi:hypothetical protein
MALFTDGPVSEMEDLAAQDTQLMEMANTEGIDVTLKITLAQEELAVELETMERNLARETVVTPALKLWHTFRALEMVYQDAYNAQLNDRYKGKRDQFGELRQWARERVRSQGVGVAADPVARAATPEAIGVGGYLGGGTYYVTLAWVNRRGQEGASAAPAVMMLEGGTLLVRPQNAPSNATGWNVYVGTAPDAMVRQNPVVLATGDTWLQPATLLTRGTLAGTGQEPDYLKALPRILERG